MISYGQDGPQGQHLQLYLWDRLAEPGPHSLTDAYAKSVLDDAGSPALMKFAALGYMAYSPQDWMQPYATAAIGSNHSVVKCAGFFLAGALHMSEHVEANKTFVAGYAGDYSEYALIGLAQSQSMEFLYNTYKGSADDVALATAMAVARYRMMNDAERVERGGDYLKSGDTELTIYVLAQVLSQQHASWLLTWRAIGITKDQSQQNTLYYVLPDLAGMVRTLGYQLTVDANGVVQAYRLNRSEP